MSNINSIINLSIPSSNYIAHSYSIKYIPSTFILPVYDSEKRMQLLRKQLSREIITSLRWNNKLNDIDLLIEFSLGSHDCEVGAYNRKCGGSRLVYDINKINLDVNK